MTEFFSRSDTLQPFGGRMCRTGEYLRKLLDFGGSGGSHRPDTAGIGDIDQLPQVFLTQGHPVVLGWYVDENFHSDAFTFEPGGGYDGVFPAQLATWPISTWHMMYQKCIFAGFNLYPFTHEQVETTFSRNLVEDNQLAEIKAHLEDHQDDAKLRSHLEDVLTGLQRHARQAGELNEGRIDTRAYICELLNERRSKNMELSSHARRILSYLLDGALMIENRGFFVTDGSLIGVGPTDNEPGDVVALIAGVETPFILRTVDEESGTESDDGEVTIFGIEDPDTLEYEYYQRLQNPKQERTKRYPVVGDCYVYGILDGFCTRFIERLRRLELH